MKHAFLIMAHSDWEALRTLLKILDHSRNDIYLHIDLKADPPPDIVEYQPVRATFGTIKRKPVYWADYSLVEVTLDLLSAAASRQEYAYYHLLSGVDLPLQPMSQLHAFFDTQDREFVGVVPVETYYSIRRVKFYHPFTGLQAYRKSKFLRALDAISEYAQRVFRVDRLKGRRGLKIYDGWQWFSITDECARFVLSQRTEIHQMFKRSIAPDELFMQTVLMNSEFVSRLNNIHDLRDGSMRLIDWKRGKPYTWQFEDWDELRSSPLMFARKFDTKTNCALVEALVEELTEHRGS